MKTEFTPGLWTMSEAFQSVSICSSSHLPPLAVIRFPSGTTLSESEARANARLMSRAPNLLGALISLEGALRERAKLPEDKGGLGYYGNVAMRNAAEEIAKARGVSA